MQVTGTVFQIPRANFHHSSQLFMTRWIPVYTVIVYNTAYDPVNGTAKAKQVVNIHCSLSQRDDINNLRQRIHCHSKGVSICSHPQYLTTDIGHSPQPHIPAIYIIGAFRPTNTSRPADACSGRMRLGQARWGYVTCRATAHVTWPDCTTWPHVRDTISTRRNGQ